MTNIYAQRPDLVTADLGDDLALLDLAGASYLGFNSTAAFVWRRLRVPHTLDQLCDAALEEFQVEPARCRAELDALISRLLSENLIETRRVA